jgi:myo-inositol-1(or 4)-monophosphatase
MTQASANVNLMIKAARKAARNLLRDFGEIENLQASSRGPADFAERARTRTLQGLREELTEARPNYGWRDADGGTADGEDPTRRWMVDPLDGAANFLHGLPHWALSIALEHKKEIVAAVIYDAAKDEMFVSEKGAGAFLNDRRLRVSGRRDLADMVFGASMARPADLAGMMGGIAAVVPRATGVRQFGAAALDMAFVAAGRLDGCWALGASAATIAAGDLIVRESGGFYGPIPETEKPAVEKGVVAASAVAFEGLRAALRSV